MIQRYGRVAVNAMHVQYELNGQIDGFNVIYKYGWFMGPESVNPLLITKLKLRMVNINETIQSKRSIAQAR